MFRGGSPFRLISGDSVGVNVHARVREKVRVRLRSDLVCC